MFGFILNDRNGNAYQSDAEQHEHVLNEAAHNNFVCENKRIFELAEKISSHQSMCPCVLIPTAVSYIGHVAELHWKCENGHSVSWTSSSIMGKNFS